jgi:hypoxanthine phosphoribosyltransferase
MPCELIDWDGFYQLARRMVRLIRRTGFVPELIVAISRGGMIPARVLSDHLNLFDLDCLKVEHYHAMYKQKIARVRYPMRAEVEGRRVLLVDDVSDTGDSFQVALAHLLEQGQPARLKTAVLHHKQLSKFVPDFFAEEVIDWRWIIYPWAVVEDLSSLWQKMQPQPGSVEAFSQRLQLDYGLRVPDQVLEDVLAAKT